VYLDEDLLFLMRLVDATYESTQ